MPSRFHVTRQVCHAPSTAIGWVSNAVPSGFACTVVPAGHCPLPYHSMRSTSPLRPGSSLDSHQAGQQPPVRQLSLMRASQVLPMPPRQVPLTRPPKYVLASRVARSTRLDLPSTNTLWRLSRYCPKNSGRSNPAGFLIGVRLADTTHLAGSGAEP